MSEWNFIDFASKDNLLRTVREQSDQMLALASAPGAWEAPTAAGHWQVRDIVGHLVDTTEGYFAGFDAANGRGTAPDPLGVRDMNEHVDAGAQAFRGTSQDELLTRLDKDRAEMLAIIEGLDEEAWNGLHRPAQVHGSAAVVLLPGRPARRLHGALVGHPPGHRPGPRAWTATPPTCSCRSASSCGSRRPTAPDVEPFTARRAGVRAATAATRGCR